MLLFSVSHPSTFFPTPTPGHANTQGGSFLYVATVIQPISETGPDDHCHDVHHEVHRASDPPRLENGMRTALIFAGMALPVGLSLLVGDHNH